ncbi:hypothetical protein OD91_0612 [Lutibacter sp. Hel_I_33_5]|uniref:alpha/beta hydrolase-fold protein n=1 Tax=Lutibacter sp. Hel_I_33_5 TaxID=1566289 RepID=UPI0011A1C477|nr:alpha/beta hydrolase-fold protein [Lutibacter sp. Hel_I_33_5]TVZ55366.1 hypothetical protein OD91_0612 [Lutibacter sp. Hel_I_33_5]
MIKKSLIILCILFGVLAHSQKTIEKRYESDELQNFRNVKIYLPKGYEKDSIANFPLAIVLDGEKLMDLYIGNANFFAATDSAPEQIVVGIDMQNTKYRDAGYIKENSKLTIESKKFLLFLRDELLPYVEANYRTSPFISIVGEGISANLITYFLKEETPIFNAYLALNPKFSKDINTQIESYSLSRYQPMDNTFYFYTNSNPFMKPEYSTAANNLATYLKSIDIKNFNVLYDDFSKSPSAVSSIGEAIPRAFSKFFEIYAGITKDEFDKKIKDLSPIDAITYLESKYLDIDFLFGSNLGIREQDIFAIEGIIIDKEEGRHLKDFGNMILKLYPTSPMGDYYLGRFYEESKQFKKALFHYRVGYGKMDPADPNADSFYENVQRVVNQR